MPSQSPAGWGHGKIQAARPQALVGRTRLDHGALRRSDATAAESSPMDRITAFAIFSNSSAGRDHADRVGRLRRSAFAGARPRHEAPRPESRKPYVVRPAEPALAIVKAMPRVDDRIFPYSTDAIGAAFTRACLFLGINTEDMPDEKRLHFHDLRHDGISRLFETGLNIPHVAAVSGHRSWTSLKRYTHLRQTGDKYEGWKWLPIVTTLMTPGPWLPSPILSLPKSRT